MLYTIAMPVVIKVEGRSVSFDCPLCSTRHTVVAKDTPTIFRCPPPCDIDIQIPGLNPCCGGIRGECPKCGKYVTVAFPDGYTYCMCSCGKVMQIGSLDDSLRQDADRIGEILKIVQGISRKITEIEKSLEARGVGGG